MRRLGTQDKMGKKGNQKKGGGSSAHEKKALEKAIAPVFDAAVTLHESGEAAASREERVRLLSEARALGMDPVREWLTSPNS